MYIALNHSETFRSRIALQDSSEQKAVFGLSYAGHFDRYYDEIEKTYINRWLYKVVDRHVFMLAIIKYGLKYREVYLRL